MSEHSDYQLGPLTLVPTPELIQEVLKRSPFAHVTVSQYDKGKHVACMVGNLRSGKDAKYALSLASQNLMLLFNTCIKRHGMDKYEASDILNEIIHGGEHGFGEEQFS